MLPLLLTVTVPPWLPEPPWPPTVIAVETLKSLGRFEACVSPMPPTPPPPPTLCAMTPCADLPSVTTSALLVTIAGPPVPPAPPLPATPRLTEIPCPSPAPAE